MNRIIKDNFTKIGKYAQNYKKAVRESLLEYRQTVAAAEEESGKYKDSAGYLSERKTAAAGKARNKIAVARNDFSAMAGAEIAALREELASQLTDTPSGAFLSKLEVYQRFNIPVIRTDIESLLKVNAGNLLGLRALNSVLKAQESRFSLNIPSEDEFLKDLDSLERLCRETYVSDTDIHGELCAVCKGQKQTLYRPDGTTFENGSTWDSTSLLISSSVFNATVENLPEMADRWAKDTAPTITVEAAKTREKAQGFVEDLAQTVEDGPEAIQTEPKAPTAGQPTGKSFAEVLGRYAGRKI